MNEMTRRFLVDLKAVLEKHGIEVECNDQYDGTESFCGTEVRFVAGELGSEHIDVLARDLPRLL